MTTSCTLTLACLLAGLNVAAATGQQVIHDWRWQPWSGCWRTVQPDTTGPMTALCVIPAEAPSAVDIVQVVNLRVVARKHVEADGERHPSAREGCTGWDRAEWSPEGRRLFLREELDCAGEPHRVSTAIMAMTGGRWLDVQGVNADGRHAVRVQRYVVASADLALPAEVVTALEGVADGQAASRLDAQAAVSPAEIMAAGRQVDSLVLGAWLTVTAEPIRLNGRQLAQLADGGVSSATIDLLVALAHPGVFAVATQEPGPERAESGTYRAAFQFLPFSGMEGRSDEGLADQEAYAMYRCATYGGSWMLGTGSYQSTGGGRCLFGYGQGPGWYRNGPVVQVVNGGTSTPPPPPLKGLVINGRGYTQGREVDRRPSAPSSNGGTQQTTNAGNSANQPGAATASGGYTGGSSTTTSTTTERTAKPRP